MRGLILALLLFAAPAYGARDFAGGASTDGISLGSFTTTTDTSWYVKVFADTLDATARRIWAKGNRLELRVTSTVTTIFANYGVTDGQWDCPAISTGAYVGILVTYNFTTASDPVVYFDGVSQSCTEIAAPAGTPATGSVELVIGNRDLDDRAFDGRIAEFALWENTILTQAHANILSKHYTPLSLNIEPTDYLPLIGRASPEPNLTNSTRNGTLTGTAAGNHPRIYQRF